MEPYLKFEESLKPLDEAVAGLKAGNNSKKLAAAESKRDKELEKLYKKLPAWDKVQVARHSARPHYSDYIYHLVEDYTPLAGDRGFSDDPAIQAGLGRWLDCPVLVLGHEKGKDAESRVRHNFGMARPEGYRKAIRLMQLAEKFGLPVISLVDTAGAYPGVGAEERGQSEAIARCTQTCLQLRVPSVAVVIGEGGSGGALAIASASRVLMLEHSIYTVASPEACASILWRSSDKAAEAADNLQVTAQSLKKLGVIDKIIPEPLGGAHRAPQQAIASVGDVVLEMLQELRPLQEKKLMQLRHEKYLAMGRGLEEALKSAS